MGNNACCTEHANDGSSELVLESGVPTDRVPDLNANVVNYLNTHKPFENELKNASNAAKVGFGKDVYVGPLNNLGRPSGYGKMYKSDGSLYIGNFSQGAAEGKGHFVFADGSYYQGEVVHNYAYTTHGVYYNSAMKYTGGFAHNMFDGQGREYTKNYVYEGKYLKGKRTQGKLSWGYKEHKSEYKGGFDDKNHFTGKGVLVEPSGTYTGDFLHGLKHGQGKYAYKSGLTYIGSYANGKKQGQGKIINANGIESYSGEFLDNLPHGKGVATSIEGKAVYCEWVQGIDKKAHEELIQSYASQQSEPNQHKYAPK